MLDNNKKPFLINVMLIDDDILTNEYNKILSTDFDLAQEIITHTNAAEALKELSLIESEYDFPQLILVDINMPGMDGHEFVTQVKEMEGFHENRTEIVFLTSSKPMNYLEKDNINSVEFLYFKPLTEDILYSILRDCFNM